MKSRTLIPFPQLLSNSLPPPFLPPPVSQPFLPVHLLLARNVCLYQHTCYIKKPCTKPDYIYAPASNINLTSMGCGHVQFAFDTCT